MFGRMSLSEPNTWWYNPNYSMCNFSIFIQRSFNCLFMTIHPACAEFRIFSTNFVFETLAGVVHSVSLSPVCTNYLSILLPPPCNRCRFWIRNWFHPTLEFKLSHISKRGSWWVVAISLLWKWVNNDIRTSIYTMTSVPSNQPLPQKPDCPYWFWFRYLCYKAIDWLGDPGLMATCDQLEITN